MQLIHLLPPLVANQIAAGEVVERPASAVKELAENSLDAGATQIKVRINKAGKKLIDIEDNGCGMSADDAIMALQRHATSKISNAEDLHCIASLGFRGEALPSIASVSRFRMQTALAGADEGIEVRINNLGDTESLPAAWRKGTRIEVRDLFLNTPARLRFMRADKTEEAAIIESIRGLALAHPAVAFVLEMDGRKRLDFPSCSRAERVQAIMGDDFYHNVMSQRIEHEGIIVDAFLGLPTYHHRDASRMMFLVNGRVIRDRQLISALRTAYRDVMFHDRSPIAVIHLEIDPADVDVNVHPSKREVRFKSPQAVRAAIVACVRAGLMQHGQHVAEHTTQQTMQTLEKNLQQNTEHDQAQTTKNKQADSPPTPQPDVQVSPNYPQQASAQHPLRRNHHSPAAPPTTSEQQQPRFKTPQPILQAAEDSAQYHIPKLQLGQALSQIHLRYILSQTEEGVLLVDQHAAHERINYERLKQQMLEGTLLSQRLLLPVLWQPDAHCAAWLHEHAEELAVFAVDIKPLGEDQFNIHAVPALLQDGSPLQLLEELVDACRLIGVEAEAAESGMGRVLERWLGNRACKSSLKAGSPLSHNEQNQLLRQMEQTPNIAQCNHGRPSYIKLSLNDLDRLFGRKG